MSHPDTPTVRLERWTGPIPPGDPDANFKADVATYAHADPLPALQRMAADLDVPVGALVHYVLARWTAGGSEGLLELGPSAVDRMSAIVAGAQERGTDADRLRAYEQLRQIIEWLRIPLDEDG